MGVCGEIAGNHGSLKFFFGGGAGGEAAGATVRCRGLSGYEFCTSCIALVIARFSVLRLVLVGVGFG